MIQKYVLNSYSLCCTTSTYCTVQVSTGPYTSCSASCRQRAVLGLAPRGSRYTHTYSFHGTRLYYGGVSRTVVEVYSCSTAGSPLFGRGRGRDRLKQPRSREALDPQNATYHVPIYCSPQTRQAKVAATVRKPSHRFCQSSDGLFISQVVILIALRFRCSAMYLSGF